MAFSPISTNDPTASAAVSPNPTKVWPKISSVWSHDLDHTTQPQDPRRSPPLLRHVHDQHRSTAPPNLRTSPRFLVTPPISTNNDENVSSSQTSRPSINLLAADDQVQHNAAVPVTPQFPTLLHHPIGCDEKPHVTAQTLTYRHQKIRESLKRAAEHGVSEAGRRKYELLSAAHRIVDVDPSTETPPFEKPNLFYVTVLNIRTDSAEMKQLIVSMASKYGLVSELAITPHLGYFRAWIGTPDAREAVAITLMFPKNIAGRNVYTFLARSSLVNWKMDCM